MVLVNERAEARGNEFSGETEVEQERLREKAGSNISKVYGGAGVYRKGADVFRQGAGGGAGVYPNLLLSKLKRQLIVV